MTTPHITTKQLIKLRNKLTGLFYADGRCFTANEDEATVVEHGSIDHLAICFTFALDKHCNVEGIAVIGAAA